MVVASEGMSESSVRASMNFRRETASSIAVQPSLYWSESRDRGLERVVCAHLRVKSFRR